MVTGQKAVHTIWGLPGLETCRAVPGWHLAAHVILSPPHPILPGLLWPLALILGQQKVFLLLC